MALKLFYDTETTGLPDWKNPSEAEHQPHLTELCAMLVDVDDDHRVVEVFETLVKPNGWIIPDDVVALNGITTEIATASGMAESFAFAEFLAMLDKADESLAYNKTFDERIVRIGLKRYFDDATADAFKASPSSCVMQAARKRMGGKMPTLAEALHHFTGETLEGAHRARIDCVATIQVHRVMWRLDNAKTVGELLTASPLTVPHVLSADSYRADGTAKCDPPAVQA